MFLNLYLIVIFYWQVEEVHNFSQDDLLTEDVLILDTHAEVFVWVGQSVDSKEKQSAFEIGQVLLKLFMLLPKVNILLCSSLTIEVPYRNT